MTAVRAELAKILTLRGAWAVTGVILALHVLVLAQQAGLYAEAVAGITPDGVIEIFVGQPEPAERAIIAAVVAGALQVGVFLPVLAAVVAGQEFRAGQLGVTLLAMPRRGRVLAAKLLATGLFVLAVAVVMAGVSVGFMYAAVKDWNPGLLVTGETFLGHARFLAFAVTYSLIGLAVTVAARSSLAGVVCTVVLFAVTMIQAAPDLDVLLPLSAARNLLLDPGVNDLSAGRGHGLLVLCGWAAVTAAVAGVALRVRDAR